MKVLKTEGGEEKFSPDKLCRSLEKSGASADLAKQICMRVESGVRTGDTTTKIWRYALGYLMKDDLRSGARYALRRAIINLGPSGFLFEQYVEGLLQSYDFDTKRNVMMPGASGLEHEIDVVAKRSDVHAFVEAKYHKDNSAKTSVNVVMYAHARLEDIAGTEEGKNSKVPYEMWVVTNTKLSSSAIRYGEHYGIILLGWDYPENGSLEDLIVAKRLYPITVLPSLSHVEQKKFSRKNLVLVRDLLPYSVTDLSGAFGVPPEIARSLLDEAYELVEGEGSSPRQ